MEPESTISWRKKIQNVIYDFQYVIWILGIFWSFICSIVFGYDALIYSCFCVCAVAYVFLFLVTALYGMSRNLILGLIFVSIASMIPPVFVLELAPEANSSNLSFYIFGFIFFLFFDLCIYIRTLKPKD